MTTNHPLPPSSANQPLLVRLIRSAAVFVARALGVFVILAVILVLFAQTQLFQDWVRVNGLALLNDQLQGKLVVDDMHVDILRGLDLHNPRLYAAGTTVLSANRIALKYDLSTIFVRVATITSLTLSQPHISIVKNKNGWNVNQIVKSTSDTAPSDPPRGNLYVRHLIVTQGSVLVNDQTTAWPESNRLFDALHCKVFDLSLDASVRLNLADHDVALAVNALSFTDASGGPLTVNGLTAIIYASKKGLDVQKLMVALPNTQLDARFAIANVDVFTGLTDSMLTQHPLVGRVEAHQVWGPDVHYFLPDIDVLGNYQLMADVAYSGNTIHIDQLELRGGPNSIQGSVVVDELFGNRPLMLDVAVTNSVAEYADIKQRLRFVPLPDLPFLHAATIDTAIVRGSPEDSLWIRVNASDKPGRVDGTLSLLLDDPLLGYHLRARVEGGDVGAFLDSTAATTINGQVTMDGRGLTLQTLDATLGVTLDPSVVLGRSIKAAKASVSANGRGTFNIDTLAVNLAQQADTASSAFLTGTEKVDVSGIVNLSTAALPTYKLNLSTYGVNLARLLRVEGLPTELSTAVTIDMEGIDLDSLHGTVIGDVSALDLQDRSMLPFHFYGSVDRKSPQHHIKLQTDFANVAITGGFTPSSLIRVCQSTFDGITSMVEDLTRHFSSSTPIQREAEPVPNLDASFVIDVQDVSPIAIVFPGLGLSGSVVSKGSVSAQSGNLRIALDTLSARNVQVFTDSLTISSDDIVVSTDMRLANAQYVDDSFKFNFKSAGNIVVNGLVLTQPEIKLAHSNNQFDFAATSGINTYRIETEGSVASNRDAAVLRIGKASFVLDSAQGLRWDLVRPATASITQGIANIELLELQRPWSETIRVSGIVSPTSFAGATVVVENFPLSDIPRFVPLDVSHPARLLHGLVTKATFVVNGTSATPVIETTLDITDISYNNSRIGNLHSTLKHENQRITGLASVRDGGGSDSSNALQINVRTLPVNLAFTSVKDRINKLQPWDITATAKDLSLSVAEPFLPAVERVRGRTNAILALKGATLDDITLSGNAKYWNGSFLSSSTNISYTSQGSISLDGNILNLDTITVQNLDRDHRGGTAVATGSVVFNGLTVDSVDFRVITPNAKGILVLNPSSQARSPIVYGDLIIASGTAPIRLYGKLASPKLVGDIDVLYSDIVFPRERSTTKVRHTSFEYVKPSDSTEQLSLHEYATKQGGREAQRDKQPVTDIASHAEEAIKSVVQASTASFADIIDYNIHIALRGRTLLTMVLSPFEILVADLELVDLNSPLKFTGKFVDNSTNLKGSVRLKEGTSTYKFYKSFQTSGTLNFTSGGMTNPDLNLIALYQNRRMINDKPEEFKVQLKITGTKEKPRIAYRVWRNDREVVGDSSKIASDALMLILVGKTTDEMMASGQGDIAGQVNAAFSSVATSALSDVISGIGFVQNAQIDLGSDITQSRITLSGQLYGDITYRVSGQISDFSGNSTFTLTVPLTVLGDQEAFRLFQADFSHTVNNTGNITRQTRLWEVKLGARLP